ncbi:MAG TPA: NAD(P)/FAD-dependent oxidoreductase, partial [Polyangiaceae bacterium]|nr:NAD(P)/FAD-dependent oxidoreductase [Polyangiaceae bacterium]
MAGDFEVPVASACARTWDVIIVGAGHNGLVAALVCARAGLDVLLVEARPVIGGATRTERPFARAPLLPTSTGAYLVGLVQPELLARLGVTLPLIRRDPWYFLPTTGSRHLLFGSDEARLQAQFRRFFSEQDYLAHLELSRELDALRSDVAPSWLEPPSSIEETAARYVRPGLQAAFVELCRGSVGRYLDRFGFNSPLLRAMYAATDGFAGSSGSWNTPGTGMNFLVHNMCRLPGSGGTWMLPRGGMGSVSGAFASEAFRAGARLLRSHPVQAIESGSAAARSVVTQTGEVIRARAIIANCDPFHLRELCGRQRFEDSFNGWLDARRRPGMSFKLNLALAALPRFTCLPEDGGQFGPTIHLLPEESEVIEQLDAAYTRAQSGQLPEFPSIEWYIHTPLDPSLTDPQGHISSALFVQWVPYALAGADWDAQADAFSDHLLSICDRFAPGTSALVVDRMALHPQRIERHFGMTFGHIHHIDNSFGFDDRFPHRT